VSSDSSKAGGVSGKLLLATAAALGSLLLLELSIRVWVAARGGSTAELAASIHRIADEIDQSGEVYESFEGPEQEGSSNPARISHPYFGWYTKGRESRIPDVVELDRKESEDVFLVIVVGGSVAASVMRPELEAALSGDPRLAGRQVRVRGEAVAGYKQPQQLNTVAYLLGAGMQPDAVVNVDGFNELAIGNQNAVDYGVHPTQPAFFLWGPVASSDSIDREALDLLLDVRAAQVRARDLAGHFDRGWSRASAAGALLTLDRMEGIRRSFQASRDRYLDWVSTRQAESGATHGPPFEASLDAVLELVVRSWAESSRSLQGLCDARGIQYLHVLQPTLYDEGSKPLTESELATAAAPDSWIEAVRAGYPLLRQEGEHLRASGVRFLDASRLFSGETEPVYLDSCHYNREGRLRLTMAIAAELLDGLADRAGAAEGSARPVR